METLKNIVGGTVVVLAWIASFMVAVAIATALTTFALKFIVLPIINLILI